MTRRQEYAKELFEKEYNCCRSTLLPFADLTDADPDTLCKIAGPYGAGISRLREVCGTVNGMAMTIGLLFGTTDASDADAKERQYALVQKLAGRFKERNGAIICKDLLGLKDESEYRTPSNSMPAYLNGRPCVELVCDMVGIIEEELKEQGIIIE